MAVDKRLFFAENQRPPSRAPGVPLWAPTLFPVHPTGPSNDQHKWIDLRVASDMARTGGVYANFRLASGFNAVADNILRFAVFVDNIATFANIDGNAQLCIVQSGEFLSAGLVAGNIGVVTSLALPPVNNYLDAGYRYLALGVQMITPTADWASGGIDAFLTDHPLNTRVLDYAGA